MNEIKRLIFKVDRLKKNYGSLEAINVKKLEIHPGTIYALVGPPGSGKTTLLEILSGAQKQSSGDLYFENFTYETNWFGKVKKHDEIFYNYGFDDYGTGTSVGKIISKMYGKKSNTIMKRHFSSPKFKHLWDRSVSSLTKGELHWVGMVLSLESDPRVLLIDEYGMYITNDMEQEFRSQLKRMNRTLGTTIIVSSPNEDLVKNFASVLIFMDNGHISKIRSKSNRPEDLEGMVEKLVSTNKRRPQNKNNSSRASSTKEKRKSDKRHSTNKHPDSDQKQMVTYNQKDQNEKRKSSDSRRQNRKRSYNNGVDDNRKKTYENKSRTNIENSRNTENRQNVQKDSGNARSDNNGNSHNVKEVDGNRLDLPNDGQGEIVPCLLISIISPKDYTKKNILVIGDIILDAYEFGKVDRISQEAPVPIVAIDRKSHKPGGLQM